MANMLLAGLGPTHPGEILAEDVLPALRISKTDFARRLNVSRQTLYDILSGTKPITTPTALKLGRLLGNDAGFWLRMQTAYDLAVAEREMADELAAIERLQAA